MLAQSAHSTTSVQTNTSSASPVSPVNPSRPSRLRGLSYLRNYTHDRLLSSRSDAPQLIRSTSTPNASIRPAPIPTQSDRESGESTSPPLEVEVAEQEPATIEQPSTANNDITTDTMAGDRSHAALSSAPPEPPTTSNSQHSTSNTHRNEQHPTIRFIPHIEMRSSRPSLHFTAIAKTLKNARGVIRVGRYTERDQTADSGDSIPVGFKSKVVSRRHCEFWCNDGQWFVKDVKSSSGTFLNHVRLSSPGAESRPYPVNDGDVVQLGIDFKGGEEVIFRCVKIRIECNRGWQKALNSFNTSTHKKLLNTVASRSKRDSDAADVSNHECSICLNPVTPCQCLFVAPCSHVWHYKCVRNLVHGPNYPNFLCPNCRFVADLEADVEPPEEDAYDELESLRGDEVEAAQRAAGQSNSSSDDLMSGANGAVRASFEIREAALNADPTVGSPSTEQRQETMSDSDSAAEARLEARLNSDTASDPSTPAQPIQISNKTAIRRTDSPRFIAMSPGTPENTSRFALSAGIIPDSLLTPRNDAGPFILDGAAGRAGGPDS